ncbi:uncharacterized protein PEZ65_022519 isoform 1-T1 [Lycodopsis pacificus]
MLFGDAVQLFSVGNSRGALNCCRVLLGLLPAASGLYGLVMLSNSSVWGTAEMLQTAAESCWVCCLLLLDFMTPARPWTHQSSHAAGSFPKISRDTSGDMFTYS